MDDVDFSRPQSREVGASAAEPAVEVRPGAGAAIPLVFASPHSGRLYPAELMQASSLTASAIRKSEDVLVDALVEGAVSLGVTLVAARYARAYIDVNREPYELDPAMFADELPAYAQGRTPRVAAGLGSIARIVADGHEIYDRKLLFAEASARIETVHKPYHAALSRVLGQARERFGHVGLIDWHSMPSQAARPKRGGRTPDFVLGDRFGASCHPRLTALMERELKAIGYEVARNAPYAGGYTTEFYGDPPGGVHVLQVEINRGLYLDETAVTPHAGFDRLQGHLMTVFAALAGRLADAL